MDRFTSHNLPDRLPWQYRLAALLGAAVMSLSLWLVWASGMKFIDLLTKVTSEMTVSQHVQKQPAPKKAIQPQKSDDPDLVPVTILPTQENAPQH